MDYSDNGFGYSSQVGPADRVAYGFGGGVGGGRGGGGGAGDGGAGGGGVTGVSPIGAAFSRLQSNQQLEMQLMEAKNNDLLHTLYEEMGLAPMQQQAVKIVSESTISGNDHKTLNCHCNTNVAKLLVGPRAVEAGIKLLVGPTVAVCSMGGHGVIQGIALAMTGSGVKLNSPGRGEARLQAAFAAFAAGNGDLYGSPVNGYLTPGHSKYTPPLSHDERQAQENHALHRTAAEAAAKGLPA